MKINKISLIGICIMVLLAGSVLGEHPDYIDEFNYFDNGDIALNGNHYPTGTTISSGGWTINQGIATYDSTGAKLGNMSIALGVDTLITKGSTWANGLVVQTALYDDATDNIGFGMFRLDGYQIGFRSASSTTHYAVRDTSSYSVTSIARTTGWHNFTGWFDGTRTILYIDGTVVLNGTQDTSLGDMQFFFDGVPNMRIDDFMQWNGTPDDQPEEAPPPPAGENTTVWLYSPSDNTVNNTEINLPFYYNVTSESDDIANCSLWLNSSGTWQINESIFTGITNNSENIIFANLTKGIYLWNIECCDTGSICSFTSGSGTVPENRTLIIDTTNPTIIPETDLGNNDTVVWNTSLDTYINFSDNYEIYLVKIIYGNGTTYYSADDLGVTNHQVNITDIINQVGLVNLTARVCDAHTLTSIKDIDWSDKNNGLEFVMKRKWWLFRDEWIRIYPKSYSGYNAPLTFKQKDRYPFIFNKKDAPNNIEVFIVESSDYIDIIGNKNYQGHLIIPSIGENGYWIDFENEESTKIEIKRISDTKIEITIYGLKSKRIEFNSIGELNCISETFYFNNINPTTSYTSHVMVGDSTTLYLNVTESNIIIDNLNATLWYNNTNYFVGVTSNFSKTVAVPTSVDGNSSLIPFYWSYNIDGTPYNTTTQYQNVSDFYIDDCTAYSTIALNFTVIDEETSDLINVDWTGSFDYSYNGINKNYALTVTADNTSQICISPNNISLATDYYIYYEETDYPQRRYYDTSATLNNVTQDIILYVLNSASGIYGRFRIIDSYSNSIEGATGIMEREISGDWTIVEQEISDGAGLMTFWLNPNDDYQFTFSKVGIGSVTKILRVTTIEIYTVTLGGVEEERNYSHSLGISYGFEPTTDLQNNTAYDFVFELDSSFWTITGCTFYLKNGTNTIDSGSSYTGSTCDVTINLDTDDYEMIIAQAIYNLNSSKDITVSTQYTVQYRYVGQFSLKNFLDDLKAFGGAGFNDFTRMMFAFIIIFAIIAGLSYKADIKEPEMLIGLLIILVWFFSYIGWLTLSGLIYPAAMDVGMANWLRQYIIALILTLAGGSFILKRVIE